jgi:hypothetical protein
MKHVALIAILVTSTTAFAGNHVNGYTRHDGTYVAPHERSSANSTRSDNYGSQSNGGSQRDEYSTGTGATNKKNSSYGSRDNDNDGVVNAYDPKPEKKGL